MLDRGILLSIDQSIARHHWPGLVSSVGGNFFHQHQIYMYMQAYVLTYSYHTSFMLPHIHTAIFQHITKTEK